MKQGIKLFVMALLTLALSQGAALAAEGKYAFVDVASIFDAYQKTKDNDRVLQGAGKKKEEQRDTMVREIRQMKDELALLSDDAKAKKQEAMNTKIKALQEFDEQARQSLGDQRNKVLKEIFKDIDDEVQAYGKSKGLEMVFNERALLYHDPKLDVTKEILEAVNKKYAGGAGKKKK